MPITTVVKDLEAPTMTVLAEFPVSTQRLWTPTPTRGNSNGSGGRRHGQRFGFTGELLESQPPHRAVTTEQMIGVDGPGTTNEMTLTEVDGGTLLSVVITYPSVELRDMVLGTGMVSGMETSHPRRQCYRWIGARKKALVRRSGGVRVLGLTPRNPAW